MNQRWPDGLFERVEAAAASMDGCSVTDLTVLALERTIADMPGASRSVASSEAAKQEARPAYAPAGPRPKASRPAPPVPGHGKGALADVHTDGQDRCPHPKARRSRGQCMACFAYLDKP